MTYEPTKKRKKGASPTSRSLAECRKRGYDAQVVERFNRFANVRVDLFGVIDIVAITPDGILGIQATVGSVHANRRDKVLAERRALAWCAAGGRLAVWSWSQRGERSKRKLWTLREDHVVITDFDPARFEKPADDTPPSYAGPQGEAAARSDVGEPAGA